MGWREDAQGEAVSRPSGGNYTVHLPQWGDASVPKPYLLRQDLDCEWCSKSATAWQSSGGYLLAIEPTPNWLWDKWTCANTGSSEVQKALRELCRSRELPLAQTGG